ncbi:molybdopterin molybdotransferase MoeA [Aquincola tertiaricarbonis]|uniref:Molybdopterin molybdenumtransferase n=1 Tax=Aquincola tertiaricarbonis TaxID=391953 RepID=A0ABY4S9E5_AQUTE|nr:gephyrin-like molybdotransferase Glp [Aquincola tertiaricarbonis]URI08820.1 molybdopterin molybdotransferase MoeA [Aquincola tertiaricarbonis]
MTATADRPGLMPLDEALRLLGEGARAAAITETETLSTFDALGRVLAAEVRSGLDVPPQDNTAMDGYAVRVADVPAEGTLLPVSQRIPAGVVGQPLQPGTAARIFTGAQIPADADAVVMQERCEAVAGGDPQGLGSVRVNLVPPPGFSIRRRGEDVRSGAVVLERGQRMTPQALGLAASVGAAQVTVLRRPRVALFSTGDELVMPDQVPPDRMPPGAIYNSNRYTLRGLLQSAGCEVTDLGIVADRLDATRDALRQAAAGHDLIITCGGVSVGDEDHVKPAVQAEGRLALWQLAIKPGKPLAFGAVRRGSSDGGEALFVGLPGNPVSAFITFMVAVRPVLQALQGLPATLPRALTARAGFDWPRPDKRREFLRVRFDDASGELVLYSNQGSGVLTSTVWADGLVDNPPGQAIARGDTVAFLPMQQLVGA